MYTRNRIAKIHFASTSWLIFCVCYIAVIALRQAGIKWWILFSLSGHGALLLLFLISLYLFAIFRGISSSQKLDIEHPLTRTTQYAFFYVVSPFLGVSAGLLGITTAETYGSLFLGTALGTLAATFLVWVIIDPVIGLLEMMLPASRKHHIQRMARAKAEREEKHRKNQHLLAKVLDNEESNRSHWQDILKPQAEKLAELMTSDEIDLRQAEQEAVGIGATAWRIGGVSCMRVLRSMAVSISKEKTQNADIVDYITSWWDGIGSWRNPSIGSQQ